MFKFTLSKEVRERLEYHAQLVAQIAKYSDGELAIYADLIQRHCQPPRFPKGTAVYDTIMYYVVIPELLKRLKERAVETTETKEAK